MDGKLVLPCMCVFGCKSEYNSNEVQMFKASEYCYPVFVVGIVKIFFYCSRYLSSYCSGHNLSKDNLKS